MSEHKIKSNKDNKDNKEVKNRRENKTDKKEKNTSALNNIIFSSSSSSLLLPSEIETKTTENETETKKIIQGNIHIRQQQRSGRKCLTIIEGLAEDLDQKKIAKYMRRMFATNAAVLKDDNEKEIIQLQGDWRKQAAEFLTKYNICEISMIKIHGA